MSAHREYDRLVAALPEPAQLGHPVLPESAPDGPTLDGVVGAEMDNQIPRAVGRSRSIAGSAGKSRSAADRSRYDCGWNPLYPLSSGCQWNDDG